MNYWWVAAILPGFFLLNEGAKLVTDTAASMAQRTGRSKFVIGVLLVSLLGGLPETLVSLFAMAREDADLAIGNALGSHILNTSMMIGLPAVFIPLVIRPIIITRDIVFLTTMTFVVSAVLLDGDLNLYEGIVLLLLFIPYVVSLLTASRVSTPAELKREEAASTIQLELIGHLFRRDLQVKVGVRWIFLGALLLFAGAELVTRGAQATAEFFGLSSFFIGITIVAFGTSLPDLAATYQAIRRGHPDLALAIGIGASIFSMLLTLGVLGIIFPQSYDVETLVSTLLVMGVQIVLLLIFAATGRTISKWEGAILFGFYPLYITMEFLTQFL